MSSLKNILDQREALSGDRSRAKVVADIRSLLMTPGPGFVGFTGLQFLTPELLAHAKDRGDAMFALSPDRKESLVRRESGGQRGLNLAYSETAAGAAVPDNKEYWHHGRILQPDDPMYLDCGDNVRVPEVPGFDDAMDALYSAFDAELDLTLELFSESLGLPTRFLSDLSAGGDDLMRDLHYLPFEADAPEGAVWGGEHTDIDFVSAVTTGVVDGEEFDETLELRQLDGTWTRVRVPRDGFMVNVGDMLQGITGGRYRSTPHRVGKPKDPRKRRRSTVFFKHPRREVMLIMLTLDASFGKVLIPWETVCEGYALFNRLIENGQYQGKNPYLKLRRDPSVPPLARR